ncbi:transposase [Porphyromonas gingivalis]|uniref:transposase n=1 Tax=Porphyromonas gingivalis TaxID=837 RepID=UPI00097D9E01|nr:transposase [Porphyromonas gingivalis]ATS08394.1 transposase [Porphyromonas gingivalis]
MRPGNTSACNNFPVFLQDTLNKLEEKKVGLVRADSCFCTKQVIESLQKQKIHYIIAACLTSTVKICLLRLFAVVAEAVQRRKIE